MLFKQKQRHDHLKDALEYHVERKELAQKAFGSWKASKDEARRKTRNQEKPSFKTDLAADEKEKNFRAWVQRKNEQAKQQRNNVRNFELQHQYAKERRQMQANAEYDKWLDVAKTKPRFVPMGQGLLSNLYNIFFLPQSYFKC